jgi:hypothetical protein
VTLTSGRQGSRAVDAPGREQKTVTGEIRWARETEGGPRGKRRAWPWKNSGGSDASLVEKKGKRNELPKRYVRNEWQVGNFLTPKQVKAGSEVLSSSY